MEGAAKVLSKLTEYGRHREKQAHHRERKQEKNPTQDIQRRYGHLSKPHVRPPENRVAPRDGGAVF